MKKILFALVVVLAVAWLIALDPLRGAFGLLFGWLIFGYVVFRALPGIRSDLARLRGHRVQRVGRYRGSFL